MSNELAVKSEPVFVKASSQLSAFLGIETGMMIETLKAQCFKGKRPDEVTDAQLAAFISVANALQLNPLVPGMLYCYPSKNGGIDPISGPDGVMKKLDEFVSSGKLDGYECEVFPPDAALPPTHATATIHRKGSSHPSKYTAIFKEWVVPSSPVWTQKPRHMLWIRALKQCARQVIHGLPMDDEEYKIAQMVNVTPGAEPAPEADKIDRPAPRKRSDKGVAAVKENASAIDVQSSTPAPEAAKPAVPAQEAPPPTQEKQPEDAPPPATEPKPTVKSLKDGERGVFVCSVNDCAAFTPKVKGVVTPSVKAEVAGEYAGTVYHLGGAALIDGKPVAQQEWQIQRKVRLTLVGALNVNTKALQTLVEKIEFAEGEDFS